MNLRDRASVRTLTAPILLSVLAALVISGCGISAAPASSTTTPTPSAPPQESPSAPSAPPVAVPPSATPSPQPTPAFEGFAAAGLTFVRFVEPGSPVSHVFVVESDGSLRQVTGVSRPESTGATFPVWSPDGSQLVFAPPKTGASSNWHVSVVNADGSGERPIAPLQDEYSGPFSWSPDGSRLVFGDMHEVDGTMIWVVDVASGEVRYLAAGSVPRWLPDGRRIAFVHHLEGTDLADPAALVPATFVMDVDGGEPVEFARAANAAWSPQGDAVLIQAAEDRLVLADGDGANARDFVEGWAPVWSPDGSHVVVAYDHNADGLPVLALVDRDGQPVWSGVVGESATWSADGSRVAIEIRYPELKVQVIDAATGVMLWETAGSQPAWRP
jgi:Tol biopolymer transport system component